jgi:two-component system, chemotaxis family, protein-glutamate methylesterase/glutaminase
MKDLRIIVAMPSPVERSRLTKLISEHPRIEVIAQAADLSEAYTVSEALEPHVVLLAYDYILVPEFDCMRSLFHALQTRWLVIGGPGVLRGPASPSDHAWPAIARDASAATILQRIGEVLAMRSSLPARRAPAPRTQPLGRMRPDRIVLIGASTGGVDALLTVLASFPADCPPTAIVQHTGKGFSDSLIKLLDRRCAAEVVALSDGLAMQVGRVCVAGGTEGHFHLSSGSSPQCRLIPGEAVSGHVPSVDVLFRSALPMAAQVVAVLLTGMGRDGAEGMLALRRAGARTLGQDAATAVVYGMPRAALEIGAVEQQLPLDRIGSEILRICARDGDIRVAGR